MAMYIKRYLGPALAGLAIVLISFVGVRAAENTAPAGTDKDAAEVARKAIRSVVRIEVQGLRMLRMATGVVMDKNGNIATTALVYPRGGRITVITLDGKRSEAEFVGFDVVTQVAVIRARDKSILSPITVGRVDDIVPGMWICVIGVSPENTASVTQGIVSSMADDRMRLNVWVTPGTSGGAVIDDQGRMVGLLRGIYTEERPVMFTYRDKQQTGTGYVMGQAEAPSSGMALAVPLDKAMDVFTQIRDKGRVSRAWLGVSIAQNLENGRMTITNVDGNSPAAAARIQVGDIIARINKNEITGPASLAAEIRKRKPYEEITMALERDGRPVEVSIKLGEYTESVAIQEMENRFPKLFRVEPGRPGAPDMPPGMDVKPPFPAFERSRFIGIYCDELSDELAGHFGVKEGRGLIVSKLSEKGPAEKAGLKVGDVITGADGRRIETRDQLIDVIQGKKRGEKIRIELIRDRKKMTREVELGEEDNGTLTEGGMREYLDSFRDLSDKLEKGQVMDKDSKTLIRDMRKISKESGAGTSTADKKKV